MEVNEGAVTEDLWTPYKELVSVVEAYLANDSGTAPYAVHTFEFVLRRHKQTFLSILKNPPKNPTSREEIKRGITEGVTLPSVGRTLLSKEVVDEAIIISDMYNVNEYLAIELLHTAQRQLPRHGGLGRGLVAVLLYYDARRARVQALKELLMAADGVSWSINAREEIITYVTRYVEQLISDGLLGNILDALRRSSLESELELLQNNRALPPHKHYVKLVASIESSRKLMAGVIFAASAQRGLQRDILLRLISEQSKSPSLGPTGALDEVSLALQMALLYALDLSVLHRREDGEELAKKLPLIQDPNLISVLVEELSPQEENEKCSGVRALCQLALGLALAALKRAPQSLLRTHAEMRTELLDQDEALVDAAIDAKVFEYLDEAILSSGFVDKEEYYQRRIHSLITDFIVLMHSKLMEMRVKADESARAVQMYVSEGLNPPLGAAHSRLGALLRCVESLYTHAPQLRGDYWVACDTSSHAHRSGGRAATLYKFVRLSGELVCASLLPSYLRALAALSVNKHTWALLARRDALSAHHLLTALARYHTNLRADPAPFSDHLHSSSLGASAIITPAARPGKLLVRQEEVEAMIAALKLIEAVARCDEAACINICENLQWRAIGCIFGLICCHIPIQLKAALCQCAGALGSYAATAARVWSQLEAERLVDHQSALCADLTEVECRMEEYPLSIAFLCLIDSLCAAAPLPAALGAGTRPPGLGPYLQHVTKLALPALHRAYARPHQKWQEVALCFRIFSRWLDQYTPSPGDFPPAGREPDACPPPGFHLLLQLHTKSELLRLVLACLDETAEIVDGQPVPGKEYVEETLLLSLRMLERALSLERSFSAAASEAGRVVLVGLSKLILVPEGATVDRVSRICLVLSHCAALPQSVACAVSVLNLLCEHPSVTRHLLCSAASVRHAFVECLETEEWPEGAQAAAIRRAKEGVVSLIHQVIATSKPNFAHVLLGYQINDDISRSALHEAGVAGSPRSCLHSILDILDKHISLPDTADREANNLIESSYRLVYSLCARQNTSAPILRYLRSRGHFLLRHVKATVHLETAKAVTISSRGWVLRAAACAACRECRGALLRTLTMPDQEWEWCLLRRTLEGLPVSVEAAAEPKWELFHSHQLRQAIEACDLPTGLGGKRISVSRLHALLARELASLNAPQRSLVAMEIQKVLDYVTEVNRQRNLAATLAHYYDSWRQLTEILFCVAPQDVLPIEARKNLLLNILQDLLNKIPPAEVLPQIGNLASGTILLLLVNLRHCYILQKRESSLQSSEFETTFFGPSNQIMQTKSLTLKFILHKILSWILVSGGSTQKTRVNLYGALLNYLNIVNLKPSAAEPEEEINETYVSRLDSSKARPNKEESSLKAMVVDVISGFGDNLCSIVCSDCISAGNDVCRMVALSCLDTLIEINPRTEWMAMLTNQGYLRSLIDSLLQDDEGLKEALEPNPKTLRVLYVYESKMALLNKIAGSRVGAETILSQGVLSCLANMNVLDCHPDIHTGYGSHQDTEFVPSVANRFRQILVPALALCDTLLTSLGTQNHSCIIHITHFLLSHMECVDMILRSAHPSSPPGLLISLEALTSVIARASNRAVYSLVQDDTALQHSGANVQRIQGLMLALLPRFREMTPVQNDADQRLQYKIVCNILAYARNILEPGRVLFPPTPSPAVAGVGAVVGALVTLTQRAHAHRKMMHSAAHSLSTVHTMTLTDMKKLLPASHSASSPTEARAAVLTLLRSRLHAREMELQHLAHAVEAALYLVWSHARVYLRVQSDHNHTALSLSAAIHVAGGEELPELRKELIAVFNDRFSEQMLETSKNYPIAQRGFIDVMLKDIKTMIQFSTV